MVVARLGLGYLSAVRRLALLLALGACRTGSAPAGPSDTPTGARASLAGDDEPTPIYSRAELERALTRERAADASGERRVAELEASDDQDAWRQAVADLAVRRRFIATLELCEASARHCPPRLDEPAWRYALDSESDPELDVPLRFDRDSWQKVAGELHGRACACRTLSCVETLEVAIARLEVRPTDEVQGDEPATLSITRARECLLYLVGKRRLPRIASGEPR